MRQAAPAKGLGGGADVALAGEEDEHVAGIGAGEALLDRVRHGGGQVGIVALRRAPAYLDRKRPARDRKHRGAVEERREGLRLERRGGDDDAQVGAARQDALQAAEDEVDVERALVRLVDHDRVVRAQQGVRPQLREKDAVCHELDAVLPREPLGEAVLPADEVAVGSELLRDALRDGEGGDAARLRAGD